MGTAWAVPTAILAVPAPSFAASIGCSGPQPFRLDWGTTAYTKTTSGGTQTGTATVPSNDGSGTAVVVTLTSTITGSVTRETENFTVPNVTNIGGLGAGEKGVALSHTGITSGRGNRQTVVIGFSRAVTGLSFSITDIDSNNANGNNDYWDQVELSGTRTFTKATNITGLGTSAANQAWHYNDDDTSLGDTSNAGIVTVTYAAAVTSITLDYWSNAGGGDQWVLLSDFTFTAACS